VEAKVGDIVSLDAKKVGQQRRTGVVRAVTQGLSGARFEIEWDGGAVSIIAPGAGILLVEGKGKAKGKTKVKPKSKSPKKTAKAAKKKAPASKKTARKSKRR
jgi:hypothetical protein